jgi:hypothetical protein
MQWRQGNTQQTEKRFIFDKNIEQQKKNEITQVSISFK